MKTILAALIVLSLTLSSCNKKEETSIKGSDTPKSSSQVNSNPMKNCYFGSTHTHSTLSADAFNIGCRTTPDQTYEYDSGLPIEYFGNKIKRKAPLDFTCLTDHSEYLGINQLLIDTSNTLSKSPMGKLVNSKDPKDRLEAFDLFIKSAGTNTPIDYLVKPELVKSNWKIEIDAANRHYKPGVYTTIHSYEWTSMPGAQNLHRNIFFRGSNVPEIIFSSLNSDKPEDLWTWMEGLRDDRTDCFAISHNGNVSNGLMFPLKDSYGNPINMQYAERRMKNEPLTEMMQTKGQSETSPTLSPNDEFADFELYLTLLDPDSSIIGKEDGSYVRQALGQGLVFLESIGANPYKMGVVGGTDFHSGANSTEEFNYPGGHSELDNTPQKRLESGRGIGSPPRLLSAAALSGVWAEENTRESIYDALKRKEVFATSGTMVKVRFFGGWDYDDKVMKDQNWLKTAYGSGVPMGSDLPAMKSGAKAPTFLMEALKDPNSGNLDRIQVIKVWTKDGKNFEKIYNAVWSGDRKIDPSTGLLPPVGNTVDVKNATYTNTIGNTELSTFWTDPDFDPTVPCCYYIRVLEIPVPRWSTYDAVKFGIDIPKDLPATIQERAWSSAIWYTPPKK